MNPRPCQCGELATCRLSIRYRYPRAEPVPEAMDPHHVHGGGSLYTCGSAACEAQALGAERENIASRAAQPLRAVDVDITATEPGDRLHPAAGRLSARILAATQVPTHPAGLMSLADDQRDAYALIRASLEGDQEATEVILDHCDLRAVAAELAYRADILASWACGGTEQALAFFTRVQRDWADDEAGT